jgi:hypothetical protein
VTTHTIKTYRVGGIHPSLAAAVARSTYRLPVDPQRLARVLVLYARVLVDAVPAASRARHVGAWVARALVHVRQAAYARHASWAGT